MMHRVCDLEGLSLDIAVAQAEGRQVVQRGFSRKLKARFYLFLGHEHLDWWEDYSPSTEPKHAARIMEAKGILVQRIAFYPSSRFKAMREGYPSMEAKEPLVAAMRCFVNYALGPEVDLEAPASAPIVDAPVPTSFRPERATTHES